VIPKDLVRPGFSFEIQAGSTTASFAPAVGAPNKMKMTMFDMKYFGLGSGDYAPNFDRELLEKWPVNELDVTRVHELGHAFGLPHLKGDNTCSEGCSGPMYGIAAPNNVAHVWPNLGF